MFDLRKMKKGSKKDPVPGTYEDVLETMCPVCGGKLIRKKKCCGSPNGKIVCARQCGYTEEL